MATTTGPGMAMRQASLLGLPRELRLQIYEYFSAFDLNYVLFHARNPMHAIEDNKTTVKSDKDQALTIPWLNLMLTCKTTAVELRSFMQDSSFLANESNRTYVLDMEATRRGRSLGKTVWHHIPCAPHQTEYLEMHWNASRGLRDWGDGGPMPIVSHLHQTLNHLLHCGPQIFDSKKPLPQHMRLKEIRILIETNEEDEKEAAGYSAGFTERETNPETTALSLGSIVGLINNTGVLKGYVDSIRINSREHALHWAVNESAGSGRIPDEWSGYGFEWGVE